MNVPSRIYRLVSGMRAIPRNKCRVCRAQAVRLSTNNAEHIRIRRVWVSVERPNDVLAGGTVYVFSSTRSYHRQPCEHWCQEELGGVTYLLQGVSLDGYVLNQRR